MSLRPSSLNITAICKVFQEICLTHSAEYTKQTYLIEAVLRKGHTRDCTLVPMLSLNLCVILHSAATANKIGLCK